MDITNRDTYYNSIYIATVVNENVQDDPSSQGRVQIYIPAIHYRLQEVYKQYINLKDKSSSKYSNQFPWAITLVQDLELGDIVYGSYVNNVNNTFIILGKDSTASSEVGQGGGDDTSNMNGTDLLSLAMPIIVENEIGINRKDWPDKITDDEIGTVTGNDNGAWSIGIIQCRATNAWDLLVDIAEAHTNWTSCWPDKSYNMYTDLQKAVRGERVTNNYGEGYTVSEKGLKDSIKRMLILGRKEQIKTGEKRTAKAIKKLQDTYKITNPALIIFGADIMNQYGEFVNNSKDYKYLRGCFSSWMKKCNDNKKLGTMEQLDKFLNEYWYPAIPKGYANYRSRRSNTYDYIKGLYKAGKLYTTSIDLGDMTNSKYIPEFGEYFWPCPKSDQINCYWGYESDQRARNNGKFKYNWAKIIHGGFHTGVDIGPKKSGVDGDPLIAVGDGKVVHVNGEGVDHRGSITAKNPVRGPSQGNCIIIQMNKNNKHNFAYMHLCKPPTLKVGDKVKAGQIVGYMGSTGSSTGTHLHIGLHIGAAWPTTSKTNKPDPLPYFGRKVK